MKMIPATELKPGHVMLLPFEKEAHVTYVIVGRTFVTFKTEEYGKSRVERTQEVMVQS